MLVFCIFGMNFYEFMDMLRTRPVKVIQKHLTDIDVQEFEMTNRGTALVGCDLNGVAFCSLTLDRETQHMLICSMYDTNCL